MTYTYAELEISKAAFEEIAAKLKEADYGHVFLHDGRVINMEGIALVKVKVEKPIPPPGKILGEGEQPLRS